ncbi:MAG: hypothetical protein ACFE0Q_03390 [Anaerolineae bacterium]
MERYSPPITLSIVLGFAGIINLFAYPTLFGHRSTGGTVLGLYSTRYSLMLVGAVILTLAWGVAWVLRTPLQARLRSVPSWVVFVCIVLICMGMIGIVQLPINGRVLQYLSVNAILLMTVLAFEQTAHVNTHLWRVMLVIGVIVMLALSFITILTERPFHLDDAHWADLASSYWVADGLYTRTWGQEPLLISPGIGWVHAVYGWILVNINFEISTGRLIRFFANLSLILGMGWFSMHHFGKRSGLVLMGVLLGLPFVLTDGSYRPNYFALASGFYLLTAHSIARQSERSWALGLHVLIGLGVTLAMELHAVALGIAIGISIFYLLDLAWHWQKNREAGIRMVIAYGIGALIGTGIYFWANIASIGGLDVYLGTLVDERYQPTRSWRWLNPPIIYQWLIVAGWGYLLWRRHRVDWYVLIVIGTVVASTMLIDTQGYFIHIIFLLMLPAGMALVDGLNGDGQLTQRLVWTSAGAMFVIGTYFAGQYVEWGSVRYVLNNRALPAYEIDVIGAEIVPYVRQDERIVTTHELIWTFWDYPELLSYGAELTLQGRGGYDDPVEVWRDFDPDVIVDLPGRMVINTGLRTYRDTYYDLCHSLNVRGFAINIYRKDCGQSPQTAIRP